MHDRNFQHLLLAAAVAAALTAPAFAVGVVVGSVTFETDNAVQTAVISTSGTIATSAFNAPIQGVGQPDVDPDHHIGTLTGASPNFAVDITNGTSGATGRTTIEMTWGFEMAAVNVVGDDLFIAESGTFNGPGGFPEAFAVAVREAGSGTFSAFRYEFFETGDAATLKLVTAYDFTDFGLAADARVDAIQVISLHNASATTSPNLEDRAVDSSGAGELILDAGGSTGFTIQQGPNSDAGDPTNYPDSGMDADIVYVAAASVVSTALAADDWALYE